MNLLFGCLGTVILIIIALAVLNFLCWALFTMFPWAVFALLIIACIIVAILRPRLWWY